MDIPENWPVFLAGALLLFAAFILYVRQQKRLRRLEGLANATRCPECASSNVTASGGAVDCQDCRCTFTVEAVDEAMTELAEHRAEIEANKRDNPFIDHRRRWYE